MSYEKKSVLHIIDKSAQQYGIDSTLKLLSESINGSEEFNSHCLITSYNAKSHKSGQSRLLKGDDEMIVRDIGILLSGYDIIHIHGIPHYGILETLTVMKQRPVIVNTAHSSVKQEFLEQYRRAEKSKSKRLVNDFNELKYFLENGILENPSRFADTYWGSAIFRQEQIMTLADCVQHVNEHNRSQIIEEYKAYANAQKHIVIPFGVKTADDVQERQKGKRLLFVGSFTSSNGVEELVEALPRILSAHPDCEIKLVEDDGKGKIIAYSKIIERAFKSYFGSSECLADYLRRIHLVLPSGQNRWDEHLNWTDYVIVPGNNEGFSLIASEALMHKRIPIMTRTGALDDLFISKGIALGIEPDERTAEGIGRTVNSILSKDSSDEYDGLVQKGREFALLNYSSDKMGKNQLETYRRLLSLE